MQYAIDAGDSVFAPELRHLLGRACRIGRRRERLTDATLKVYAARLEARLDELMAHTPTHAAGVKLQRIVKKIIICETSNPTKQVIDEPPTVRRPSRSLDTVISDRNSAAV